MRNRVIHLYDKTNFMDTLCGKISPKRGENLNITKNPKKVTCGSCLRSKRFPIIGDNK